MQPTTPPPANMDPAEWQVRCDLAALYRLADRYGMSDLIYTHISARVPGTHDFLINPLGTLFGDMTASALVRIDLDGVIVDPALRDTVRVNAAGFNIHSAVHRARADIACVIHSHTVAGMALSAQTRGLLPLTQHAMMFHDGIAFHDYESFATKEDERERIAADLGDKDIMILRNHGMLVGGRSIGEAFHSAYHLERATQAQLMATAGGAELNMPNQGVPEATATRMRAITQAHYAFFFESCLALLAGDRTDWRR
ncbi:class II aldolase/adducin family protein [Sphingomonas sp. MMS24-J13]|uniref:class II aldolase/adducin family protein n=1 Tax=Sphingomonas sp. MMS24-J13 TaxID=3238686 RepID=UPI00384FF0B4